MSLDPTSTLRVGVIGVGAMGTAHVRTLASWVPGAQVVAVHDAAPDRAADVAAEVGADVADSADQLIRADEVDAVVVAAPDPVHEELALSCLDAGKPVLCEKPLAVDVAGSRRIVDAEVAGGRRRVQVGFMRRYDHGFRQLRALVAAGELGAPRVVHCVHRNPHAHPSASSEGVVVNSMIHDLDTAAWLLGEPLAAITLTVPRRPRGELLDPQVAVVESVSGVIVTVEVFVNARYGYDVACEVVGDAGTARLTPPYGISRRREGTDGLEVTSDFVARFADAYRVELAAWVAAARTQEVAGPTAWDGHRAGVAAAAGVMSLRTGGRVAIADEQTPTLYRLSGDGGSRG